MGRTLERISDGIFDRLNITPLGLLVVGGTGALVVLLHGVGSVSVEAPAVAQAPSFAYAAPLASVVAEVKVAPGQQVAKGDLLLVLSDATVKRELATVDAEIERVQRELNFEWESLKISTSADSFRAKAALLDARREADLAEAERSAMAKVAASSGQLKADAEKRAEERLVDRREAAEAGDSAVRDTATLSQAERRAAIAKAYVEAYNKLGQSEGSGSMASQFDARVKAELAALTLQRDQLTADLASLSIRAREAGFVSTVAAAGQGVVVGDPVAQLSGLSAGEVVAFLPADTAPGQIEAGAPASLLGPGWSCAEPALVLSTGPEVVEAPGQVSAIRRMPVFGRPVHLRVPASCRLAAGQVLTARFAPKP